MSSFAGNKNDRENDNKTKEIHEQFQGHGCLGREHKIQAKLSKEFEISPNQISQWKQEAIRNMEKAFGEKGKEKSEEDERSIRILWEKVGELTIERDFFEDACKRLGLT